MSIPQPAISADSVQWTDVRKQFLLSTDRIHMAQMLLSSHPAPVRNAIVFHRNALDHNPTEYYEQNYIAFERRVCEAAARYTGTQPDEIVLTDSTTMGLALLCNGLNIKEGEEILTTTHDHYSTEKSLEYAALKNKAKIRRVQLYENGTAPEKDQLIINLLKGISPRTRFVLVTWVHSGTGLKLPIAAIAEAIKEINATRSFEQRICLCVDGVHAFGIESTSLPELGCDFFVAGGHKWLFGPRGTGIFWAKKESWDILIPTIPSFSDPSYYQWTEALPKSPINFCDLHTPGGFHAFEHMWSLNEAFDFHMNIGKKNIQQRTQELNTLLKEGLKEIKHLHLITPITPELSCGITCFEIDGVKPETVIKKLHARKIIGSVTPYKAIYPRLTPSIINSQEEVYACIRALERILE